MFEDFEKFIKDPFFMERIVSFRNEVKDIFLKIMDSQGLTFQEKAFITCDIAATSLAIIRAGLDESLVETIVKHSKLISENMPKKAI